MNDNWYDEHMFEIAPPLRSTSQRRCSEGLETNPVVLEAWDPMGSLEPS
jgi:aminopeptidase C